VVVARGALVGARGGAVIRYGWGSWWGGGGGLCGVGVGGCGWGWGEHKRASTHSSMCERCGGTNNPTETQHDHELHLPATAELDLLNSDTRKLATGNEQWDLHLIT